MKSPCCLADLETHVLPELYHGSDDEYELVLPFLFCSECGNLVLTASERVHENRWL
ncbi:hypothetical protein [Peribacillus tepidiphilus]|uniref:hypothetical protein n=1 Tax=Peribacillus tepidiphilus TaxID=2652445 RepID=UPI0012924E85|nr:hypothetical protein [Peribacillus tepidiphilus]